MSHAALQRFQNALKTDPELFTVFHRATGVEHLATLIRGAGFDVTRQDLIDVHGLDGDLPDGRLEAVAGASRNTYAASDFAGAGVALTSCLARRGRHFGH